MARECKTVKFFTADCPDHRRFVSFVGALNRLYGIQLQLPRIPMIDDLERRSFFKKFCSGLLEGRIHPWDVILRNSGLSRDTRFSISMSLFLFRKTLPSTPPDADEFLNKISVPSPEPDPLFLEFIRKEIPRLFRFGWDRDLYPSRCLNTVLPLTSCVERGRVAGGCRSLFLDNRTLYDGRESFVESVLTRQDCPELKPSRLNAVETAGKHRLVAVPCFEMNQLRPLHTAIYDHISRFPWLLRGDAKPSRFVDFVHVPGELFVSGDYESATDNLNVHVQKEILSQVLMRCVSTPNGIRQLAMKSLSTELTLQSDGKPMRTVGVLSGQMMGYLLSFPLLCLVNYLAFRFSIKRDVPVRINGDDIVFRSTQAEYDVWRKTISSSGLVLSEGKTMVNSRYFSLNSSLFKAGVRKVVVVPFIRSTALFSIKNGPDSILSLPGRFRTFCPGYNGRRRSFLRTEWLRVNRSLIDASRRSLTRGLRLPLKLSEIQDAGLWDREAWYLSLESEKDLPSPLSEWMSRPTGYVFKRVSKITKELREEQKEVGPAFVDAAWQPSHEVDRSEWEYDLVRGLPDWGGWFYQRSSGLVRRARLLGLSPSNARRFLRPSVEIFFRFKPSRSFPVWTRLSSMCVRFVTSTEN